MRECLQRVMGRENIREGTSVRERFGGGSLHGKVCEGNVCEGNICEGTFARGTFARECSQRVMGGKNVCQGMFARGNLQGHRILLYISNILFHAQMCSRIVTIGSFSSAPSAHTVFVHGRMFLE